MLKLDNTLLDELGLGALPADQKRPMLQHIYDTLELRVGTTLANQMTDQQLDEFERFIDSGGDANQAQALQWLEANLPNYKQVVNDVFEALKGEIRQMAPQILGASGSAPAAAPVASMQGPVVSSRPDPAPDYAQQPVYGGQQNLAGNNAWGASLQQSPQQMQQGDYNQPYPAEQPPAGPGM